MRDKFHQYNIKKNQVIKIFEFIFIIKMIITKIKKNCILKTFNKDKVGLISIFFLFLWSFSMSLKYEFRLSYTNNSSRWYNAIRLITILKWQIIKSSSIMGYGNKKEKFAIQTCFKKMFFGFLLKLAASLNLGNLASYCLRLFILMVFLI